MQKLVALLILCVVAKFTTGQKPAAIPADLLVKLKSDIFKLGSRSGPSVPSQNNGINARNGNFAGLFLQLMEKSNRFPCICPAKSQGPLFRVFRPAQCSTVYLSQAQH
jgi:hypothetical protein